MKKKKLSSFCCVVLILLVAFLAFKEIKDTIQGEKVFFLTRWQYRNPEYAKYIEIKPYVLNQKQLAYMINHPDEEIEQPPEKDLYLKDVSIVLRLKNHGDLFAFGKLSYKFEHFVWMKVDIEVPRLTPKRNHYYDIIIPLGVVVLFDKDCPPTPIQYKWDALYTAP